MKCPVCGKEQRDGAVYCSNCGSPLPSVRSGGSPDGSGMPDPDADTLSQEEAQQLLEEVLSAVPSPQRDVLTLHMRDRLSEAEIARRLAIPESEVRKLLSFGQDKAKTKILEMEKRGTKLYSLAPLPFLAFLFGRADMQAAAAAGTAAGAAAVQEAAKSSAAAGSGSSAGGLSGTASAASNAADSGAASAATDTAAAVNADSGGAGAASGAGSAGAAGTGTAAGAVSGAGSSAAAGTAAAAGGIGVKMAAVIAAAVVVVGGAAYAVTRGGGEEAPAEEESVQEETVEETEEEPAAEEELPEEEETAAEEEVIELMTFDPSASVEETLLYDAEDVQIYAVSLSCTDDAAELTLRFVNNSAVNVFFTNDTVGSGMVTGVINGCSVGVESYDLVVSAGESEELALRYDLEEILWNGMEGIGVIEDNVVFWSADYSLYESLVFTVETTAAGLYADGTSGFMDNIVSGAASELLGYTILASEEYESFALEGGVSVIGSVLVETEDGRILFMTQLLNSSDEGVSVWGREFTVNGLMVDRSYALYEAYGLDPGNTIVLAKELEPAYRESFGLQTPGEVSCALYVKYTAEDGTGTQVYDSALVLLEASEDAEPYDSDGIEVYSGSGIHITAKNLTTMDGYAYLLLLVENDLDIDIYLEPDYYDEILADGVPSGAYAYNGITVNAGSTSAWDICLSSEELLNAQTLEFSISIMEEDSYALIEETVITVER